MTDRHDNDALLAETLREFGASLHKPVRIEPTGSLVCQVDLATWPCPTARLAARVRELEAEVEGLRGFYRSVNEALNSGDGVYRP